MNMFNEPLQPSEDIIELNEELEKSQAKGFDFVSIEQLWCYDLVTQHCLEESKT